MSAGNVSANLRAILDMAERLEARAIDRAGDDIPGGEAMVNLALVADMTVWERRDELAGGDLAPYEDPDQMWSAFQMLRFWSEQWRIDLDMDHDDPRWRPSLASEAAFLRNPDVLAWAWDNEPHFEEFAADVATAKSRLENVLSEGVRSIRGVPCMYDECKGKRLVRKMKPMYRTQTVDGEKVRVRVRDERGNGLWELEDWHCPRCHRRWDEDAYAAMVTAANEAAKVEVIDGQTWCTTDYAARKVGRPASTVRVWLHREELTVACMIAGRRLPFVSLEEVRDLSEARPARSRDKGAS